MDVKKLSTGEMIIGISGIVLFFDSFLDWFGLEIKGVPGASGAESAWSFTLPLFAVLLGIAMVVLVALRAFGVVLPEKIGGYGFRLLYLLGGLAFLLVLLKIIVGPDYNTGPFSDSVNKTRELGAFIGLLATAGLAVGGFMAAKEAGDLDEIMKKGNPGGSGGSTPPPPAA